jgi:hypothetical protein
MEGVPSLSRVGVTRRALLATAGATVLLAAAGCNPFASAPKTLTVTAAAPPPADPLEALIARINLHVLHIDGAIRAKAFDANVLAGVRADRIAHLTAVQAEYDRSIGVSPSSSAPTPGGTVAMPEGKDAIMGLVRQDAGDDQVTFTDAMVKTTSRYRAALFSSIAACLATHREVLT